MSGPPRMPWGAGPPPRGMPMRGPRPRGPPPPPRPPPRGPPPRTPWGPPAPGYGPPRGPPPRPGYPPPPPPLGYGAPPYGAPGYGPPPPQPYYGTPPRPPSQGMIPPGAPPSGPPTQPPADAMYDQQSNYSDDWSHDGGYGSQAPSDWSKDDRQNTSDWSRDEGSDYSRGEYSAKDDWSRDDRSDWSREDSHQHDDWSEERSRKRKRPAEEESSRSRDSRQSSRSREHSRHGRPETEQRSRGGRGWSPQRGKDSRYESEERRRPNRDLDRGDPDRGRDLKKGRDPNKTGDLDRGRNFNRDRDAENTSRESSRSRSNTRDSERSRSYGSERSKPSYSATNDKGSYGGRSNNDRSPWKGDRGARGQKSYYDRKDGASSSSRERDGYQGRPGRGGDRRDGDIHRKHRGTPDIPQADLTPLSDPASRPSNDDPEVATFDGIPYISDPTDPAESSLLEAEVDLPPPPKWTRCCPADLYFTMDRETGDLYSTERMRDLEAKFEYNLVRRARRVRDSLPPVDPPLAPLLPPVNLVNWHSDKATVESQNDDSSDESSMDEEEDKTLDKLNIQLMDELERKRSHPERMHPELWFNIPMEMNDGPLCHCSEKAKKTGLRHNKYPGEENVYHCDRESNNARKLYHYTITMSPPTNFLTKTPTVINYDNHEYIFEGFSMFSHYKIEKQVPICKVIRFNIEYTIHWLEDDMPKNFTIESLDLFSEFLFTEILELYDLDWKPTTDQCAKFHFMPRFARNLPDNGKELLSMPMVLNYLLRSSCPLVDKSALTKCGLYTQRQWQSFVDQVRGMLVTYPGKRPSALRIDQLDRHMTTEATQEDGTTLDFPRIIHFGVRPAQLSYAGDPTYQRVWKEYMKLKHLVANKPKVTTKDKEDLKKKEDILQDIRIKGTMKREVTIELSSEGYTRTGIRSDVSQHALLLPVLITHLRFHKCLSVLEKKISYRFKDPYLLQLALTHPSYRTNYGTNPDHSRNSLSNCGMRQLEYGDRRVHYVHTRKRGINTLIHIMAKLGRREETSSEINHYERLEFLGDAVVEFLSSIHLFFMFPNLAEGGLAMYRSAIVQNQHLTVLAKKLGLQNFMLYGHGPDLCQDYSLRHAMANCFEALMGALLIDSGIEVADRVFGYTLFGDQPKLIDVYTNLAPHPLQEDEPNGDRHWIASSAPLQKMQEFEQSMGVEFTHIRLLARAFTMRNVGFNHLTYGHNQRMEFLGDTVLQFISSEYLYKHFPDHHEGHLSLLRSSLVNNRTQAVVCDDLGMAEYIINTDHRSSDKGELKMKEKADLVEAFLGALYIDKDLEFCKTFCKVCFFPRLKQFIMNQDWNDPKSQLQQCCLTLRELHDEDPDIPTYKVLQSTGPTNTRKYTVAVYFRGKRMAVGEGHSIQQAEMDAASNALMNKKSLFPHLLYQKAFLARKFKRYAKKGQLNPGDDRNRYGGRRVTHPSMDPSSSNSRGGWSWGPDDTPQDDFGADELDDDLGASVLGEGSDEGELAGE